MILKTIGSLFSGIGGLELGLEWAGCGKTIWQVEQDEHARRVLEKHWPQAKRHKDVRLVGRSNLDPVDIVCGGFPCQDLSFAGKGAGLSGARSGLWKEFVRIIRELRPKFVVVENVPALAVRGFGVVLGDLAKCGYDALWTSVSASDVGAPHRRERLFVVGWIPTPNIAGIGRNANRLQERAPETVTVSCHSSNLADPNRARKQQPNRRWSQIGERSCNGSEVVPDAHGLPTKTVEPGLVRDTHGVSERLDGHRWPSGPSEEPQAWEPPRTARGVANREHRIRCLGNAVVPQVAYAIGCVVNEISNQLNMEASHG